MSQLVDDLLWLARSDRIHVPTRMIPIPLEDLLEDVLDQYMPQAEQKQIDLKADLHSPLSVLGDPQQLKRLFANLITNALHYTPSGGTVTLSSQIEPDDWVSVRIVDTGIGIAPEHLPFIFDRFWRADQGRAPGRRIGLGVSHCSGDRPSASGRDYSPATAPRRNMFGSSGFSVLVLLDLTSFQSFQPCHTTPKCLPQTFTYRIL